MERRGFLKRLFGIGIGIYDKMGNCRQVDFYSARNPKNDIDFSTKI